MHQLNCDHMVIHPTFGVEKKVRLGPSPVKRLPLSPLSFLRQPSIKEYQVHWKQTFNENRK